LKSHTRTQSTLRSFCTVPPLGNRASVRSSRRIPLLCNSCI
jgi:hypothetical protein